jgi:hypothetical protein
MAPAVPILLYCRLRYLRDSEAVSAALRRSALGGPRELPCKLRLSMLGHFSINFANISIPTSEISLKDKSMFLTSWLVKSLLSSGLLRQKRAELYHDL